MTGGRGADSLPLVALTKFDDIIAAWGSQRGQLLHFEKTLSIASTARQWQSLWPATGIPEAGGNTASGKANGRVLTKSTTGALPFTNAPNGLKTYVTGTDVFSNTTALSNGMLLLVDRISDCQIAHNEATGAFTGLDATSRLGPTSGNGDGCMIFLEVTNTFSAASNNLIFTYTNQVGTGSRTSATVATTASMGNARSAVLGSLWVPLQAGDTGVRSIESMTLSSGTATGNLNVCLMKPLAAFAIYNNNQLISRDFIFEIPVLPRIRDNACLSFLFCSVSAAQSMMVGALTTVGV